MKARISNGTKSARILCNGLKISNDMNADFPAKNYGEDIKTTTRRACVVTSSFPLNPQQSYKEENHI